MNLSAVKQKVKRWIRALKIYSTSGFLGDGSIRIEAASACQLRCPVCVDVWQVKKGVGSGTLRFNDFKAFIDRHPHFNMIELSNKGEIFLNNDLDRIMQYAHSKRISLTALNGVNFNHVRAETFKNLVQYGFKAMTISIDGATQATYEKYRVRGNLERVLNNIRKLNEYKELFHAEYPRLRWRFLVFAHNEHEIPLARQMAGELGMTFVLGRNSNPEYIPSGAFPDNGKSPLLEAENESYCWQLLGSPQINWDGRLLGCCVNASNNDYGNVFTSGLKACIRSEKYQYAIAMLKGKKDPRKDIFCVQCRVYQEMQQTGNYIK